MNLFRLFLIAALGVITVYTAVVIANHGLTLFPVFFGDMATMGWAGQFNLDFMFMLALSALWTAWRNGFSASGIPTAVNAAARQVLLVAVEERCDTAFIEGSRGC